MTTSVDILELKRRVEQLKNLTNIVSDQLSVLEQELGEGSVSPDSEELSDVHKKVNDFMEKHRKRLSKRKS